MCLGDARVRYSVEDFAALPLISRKPHLRDSTPDECPSQSRVAGGDRLTVCREVYPTKRTMLLGVGGREISLELHLSGLELVGRGKIQRMYSEGEHEVLST